MPSMSSSWTALLRAADVVAHRPVAAELGSSLRMTRRSSERMAEAGRGRGYLATDRCPTSSQPCARARARFRRAPSTRASPALVLRRDGAGGGVRRRVARRRALAALGPASPDRRRVLRPARAAPLGRRGRRRRRGHRRHLLADAGLGPAQRPLLRVPVPRLLDGRRERRPAPARVGLAIVARRAGPVDDRRGRRHPDGQFAAELLVGTRLLHRRPRPRRPPAAQPPAPQRRAAREGASAPPPTASAAPQEAVDAERVRHRRRAARPRRPRARRDDHPGLRRAPARREGRRPRRGRVRGDRDDRARRARRAAHAARRAARRGRRSRRAAPQPTLDDAARAGRARPRAAASASTLDVEGDAPGRLPAGVDLTAYRVVQDALRAAREDGGAGAAQVTVRYRADRLEIEVADDGVPRRRAAAARPARARAAVRRRGVNARRSAPAATSCARGCRCEGVAA